MGVKHFHTVKRNWLIDVSDDNCLVLKSKKESVTGWPFIGVLLINVTYGNSLKSNFFCREKASVILTGHSRCVTYWLFIRKFFKRQLIRREKISVSDWPFIGMLLTTISSKLKWLFCREKASVTRLVFTYWRDAGFVHVSWRWAQGLKWLVVHLKNLVVCHLVVY